METINGTFIRGKATMPRIGNIGSVSGTVSVSVSRFGDVISMGLSSKIIFMWPPHPFYMGSAAVTFS
jgi:hypothetical protein